MRKRFGISLPYMTPRSRRLLAMPPFALLRSAGTCRPVGALQAGRRQMKARHMLVTHLGRGTSVIFINSTIFAILLWNSVILAKIRSKVRLVLYQISIYGVRCGIEEEFYICSTAAEYSVGTAHILLLLLCMQSGWRRRSS